MIEKNILDYTQTHHISLPLSLSNLFSESFISNFSYFKAETRDLEI
jgi:hypothetical protein